MQLVFGLVLILWSVLANFVRKHFNVLTILLINSYFLGFIDRDSFGILNKFDLNAFCLLFYLILICSNFSWRRLNRGRFTKYFCAILVLYIYGVVYPCVKGYSSIFWAVKEGKEFIHYLSFFAIYLSIRSQQDINWSWKYIIFLSIYYVFLELAYPLGAYKFTFLHYLYRSDSVLGIVKVYQPIFAIVFLAMFYQLWRTVLGGAGKYFQVGLLFIAGLFTAFRSYILGSFIAIGFCLVFVLKGRESMKVSFVFFFVVLLSLLTLSITFSDSIVDRFTTVADNYIFSGVREMVSQKGGSLEGRRSVNRFRWEYFAEKPWLGYGFVDKKSALGRQIYLKYGRELTMIDTGYLDVLIKFGIIGSVFFLSIFLRICWILFTISKYANNLDNKIIAVTLLCFIITLLCSQVTHGGFTYAFGIVPLSIAVALFDAQLNIDEKMEGCNG